MKKLKQGITVIGSNPIQSMDGSNPCPTLRLIIQRNFSTFFR